MLSTEEYRAALVAARDEWHSKDHPFFTSWAKGELTKDAMKAYVQQHYNFVSNASRYYGIIYGLCPWWDARNFYLENLNEEEDPNERHVDKLAKFGIALGMTIEESRTAPDLPTTAALKDFILNTALTAARSTRPRSSSSASSRRCPQLYEPIVPALRDIYGFTDDEIEFFLLHITADVEHGEKGFQILLEHTEDEQTQHEVIETVREASKKRWFYMDGMYMQYVEGRQWYPCEGVGLTRLNGGRSRPLVPAHSARVPTGCAPRRGGAIGRGRRRRWRRRSLVLVPGRARRGGRAGPRTPSRCDGAAGSGRAR